MKKRMLSLLLTLVMVLGMLPATTMTANALMYIGVDTWEELVEELTTGDAGYIMLEDDIKYKMYYSGHENNPKEETSAGWLPRDFEHITIQGAKTLDLNGYSIEVVDETNASKSTYGGDVTQVRERGFLYFYRAG